MMEGQSRPLQERRNLSKEGSLRQAHYMGVRGFDAAMLVGWMKNMRTMYGKDEKKYKGKSSAAPPILTSLQRWVLDTFGFLRPHLNVGISSRILGQVSFIIIK